MTALHNAPSPVTVDADLLKKSQEYCRDLTKREAKNFYYGLKLLKDPKRTAMYALYAYMRLVDDIADDTSNGRTVAQRRADLDQWQTLTHQALASAGVGISAEPLDLPRGHILWPAFADMVRRYRVPAYLFDDMIAGQRQDLEPVAIQTFDELYQYCYRVASVVGVASLYVWGFDGGDATLKLSIDRGIAFQLTNILRDLREDAALGDGRCYIPQTELTQFGVSPADFAAGRVSDEFLELMRFQVQRAESYYQSSSPLARFISKDSRPTLAAMTDIYHGILQKITADPRRVLNERVRLTTFEKLKIGWRAMRSKS